MIRRWLLAVIAACAFASSAFADGNTSHLFFDDHAIQDVYLTVDPADWASLRAHYLDNTYYKANFVWNGTSMDIGIRSRGRGTRSPDKPNLDLNLDKYVKKQKLLGISFIVLKGSNSDASMMREILAFRVFQRMGLPAPRETFARLYINGDFFGLYVACEHEDEDFLERNFGESDGFLYEFKPNLPFFFEYLGEDPASYSPILFDPKTHEDDPNPQPIIDMVRTVNQASDSDFVQAASKYLNLNMFVDEIATETAVADFDNTISVTGMNNFYLYRFQDQTLSQIIVWDKDNAFTEPMDSITRGIDQNILARRVMVVPEFRTNYLHTLLKAADIIGGEGGWADTEVSRYYAMIRDDARRDPHKQCSSEGVLFACGADAFEADVKHLHEFFAIRSAFLRSEVAAAGYKSEPDAPQVADGGVVNAGAASVSSLAPGGLATLYGAHLLALAGPAQTVPTPRELSGVSILVDGAQAPVLYASDKQINFQVPWEAAPGQNAITVSAGGKLANSELVEVKQFSPAILLAAHLDGTAVTSDHPAARGEKLQLFAVGLGPVDRSIPTGEAALDSAPASTVNTVQVKVAAQDAQVSFSGLVPGVVGVYRVEVDVPASIQAGNAPVSLKVGDEESPVMQIPIA